MSNETRAVIERTRRLTIAIRTRRLLVKQLSAADLEFQRAIMGCSPQEIADAYTDADSSPE